MSGGDWGLVGLGGSKHGPQSLTFFLLFFFLNWWNVTLYEKEILFIFSIP